MPRITIDHHDSRADAISTLVSLRKVGMQPGDVGSVWLRYPAGDAPDAPEQLPGDLHQTTLTDLGAVQLSGWIAAAANAADARSPGLDLATLLADADLDDEELAKVRDTLASGGGVIGVRA